MRYPIPNRRGEKSTGSGPVIEYRLDDVELALLRAGERGIKIQPEQKPKLEQKAVFERKQEPAPRNKHNLSEPVLRRLRDAGLTVTQISAELEIPAATVRLWLGNYGIRTARRRRHDLGDTADEGIQ